jgi:hypothetical protein
MGTDLDQPEEIEIGPCPAPHLERELFGPRG